MFEHKHNKKNFVMYSNTNILEQNKKLCSKHKHKQKNTKKVCLKIKDSDIIIF
jgi:hypothetical protein